MSCPSCFGVRRLDAAFARLPPSRPRVILCEAGRCFLLPRSRERTWQSAQSRNLSFPRTPPANCTDSTNIGKRVRSRLQIQPRRTGIGSPETNGFCERFHRTVKEEFYAVAFRKTFYESLEQLQRDLDQCLVFYNREPAHQGYRTEGRTPYQTFLEGTEKLRREEVKPEAAYAKIGCHRNSPVSAHLQLNTPRTSTD